MAKKTARGEVIIRVTAGEFLTISNAIEVCRAVADLDQTNTFAEFEAKMDRTIEFATRVRDALKDRTVHFVDDKLEDSDGTRKAIP